MTIEPHGGTLINRRLAGQARKDYIASHSNAKVIKANDRLLSDVYLIAIGGLSPLTGFMNAKEYKSVVETMHLTNGLAFSIPVTLAVTEAEFKSVNEGDTVLLQKIGRAHV